MSETPMLTMPTIHLNGTSPARLREKYEDAVNAISKAMEAMQETAPHGRDYYPQDPPLGGAALARAKEEHFGRMKRLQAVQAELEELWHHVNASICQREQSRKMGGMR